MIIIFGMHRSGTSMVSGVLDSCGINIGISKGQRKDKSDRPEHHYEDCTVVDINDKILEMCGGSWFDVPDYEKILNYDNKTLRDKAFEHIKHRVNNGGLRGLSSIKDPRMTITFQWWINNFRDILGDIKPIWIKREIDGITRSLIQRDQWAKEPNGEDRAKNLIQTYNRYFERTMNQFHMNCLRITYEYILINPDEGFRTICGYIGINPYGEYRERAMKMIRPGLKRN